MRIFLFLGMTLIFLSCQNEKKAETQEQVAVVTLDSLSKEKIKLELLKLSPDAEKSLESFDDFQNMRSFITVLRDANPFFVNKHVDSIDLLVSTFKENLTEELKTNTIHSRIRVLYTEIGLLKLITEKKNQDPKKVLEANKRLIIAYNSLIIQLNELSLAIPENIEKELLREIENKK